MNYTPLNGLPNQTMHTIIAVDLLAPVHRRKVLVDLAITLQAVQGAYAKNGGWQPAECPRLKVERP